VHGGVQNALGAWHALLVASLLAAGALLVAGCDDEEPEGTLEFGEVCETATEVVGECISEMCEETDLGGVNKRCTQACDDATPCPSGVCGASGHCTLGPPPLVEGEEVLKVGMVYIGSPSDHGWTKSHEDGRLDVVEALGTTVEIETSSAVFGNDQAPAQIQTFIDNGDEVIIGTSFDFLPSLQQASGDPANANVNFLTCSGFQTAHNLGSYFGRMEQAMYLMGIVAGQMTTTNQIGIVGPVVIPETVRLNNAFTIGVREVNSNAQVVVRWVGNWYDPANETLAAEELIHDFDCDIIFGHTDTQSPLVVVRDLQDGNPDNGELTVDDPESVFSMGYDNPDSCVFDEDHCLGSAYWNWGPVVTRILEDMMTGDWNPSVVVFEQINPVAAESMVYANLSEVVPATIADQIPPLIERLSSDDHAEQYFFWEGPINDAQGDERLAAGEIPDDEMLLSMCWYTEGLIDTDAETPNVAPATCPGEF
jgi:basic membrane protein A